MMHKLKIILIVVLGLKAIVNASVIVPHCRQNKVIAKNDTLLTSGKILKKAMETKKGDSPHTSDYFFETNKNSYFIKLSESKISESEIEKQLTKKVTLKYILKSGSLDNSIQSRDGDYIVVFSMQKK